MFRVLVILLLLWVESEGDWVVVGLVVVCIGDDFDLIFFWIGKKFFLVGIVCFIEVVIFMFLWIVWVGICVGVDGVFVEVIRLMLGGVVWGI